MASTKKAAIQPKNTAKTVTATKKTVATKTAVEIPVKQVKKVVAPVKKQAETVKSAPVKKAAPVAITKDTKNTKVAEKSVAVKKDVVAPKAAAVKKAVVPAKVTTPVKKAVVPTKETAPVKKAAPVKAAEPKKIVVEPKKPVAAPAKPVENKMPAAAPAKPVEKTKSEPVAVKEVAKKATSKSSSANKKSVPTKTIINKPIVVLPKPLPTPVVRSTDKKPLVVIAHRKLDNKSKPVNDDEVIVPYKPEVYRSILDEPTYPAIISTVYRYNDEDLTEFKILITNRLEAARKELVYLQGLITRKDEAGTEDTENRFMNMEDGSGAMEREQLAQLAGRQIQFISHLEKALLRIENKTYGVCRVTGKLIDKARLRAVPHATLSIEAKKTMAK